MASSRDTSNQYKVNMTQEERNMAKKIRDLQKHLVKNVADGSKKKLRKGEDIAMVGAFQETQMLKSEIILHEAARKNNIDVVKRLVANKINVNATNSLDRTAVQWAAANGCKEVMAILLEAGADIEAFDKYGMRPIHWSAWFNQANTLEFLILCGAEVGCVNKRGLNILHCASNQNSLECIDYIFYALVEDMFELDTCAVEHQGRDAIHLASKEGHLEALEKLLVKIPKYLDKKDQTGNTALHLSAVEGHTSCISKLLDVGYNVNAVNEEGKSPLYGAAENGHVEAVEFLLKVKPDPDLKATKQQTALHIATQNGHTDVVLILIQHGCDLNAQTETGNTALHLAATAGVRPIISALIKNNCKLNMTNYRMLTALHSAVEKGNADTVEELLINGADTTIPEKHGRTALYMAARGSFIGIVDMIIKTELYKDKMKDFMEWAACSLANEHEDIDDFEGLSDFEETEPEDSPEPENPYKDFFKKYRHPHAEIMKPILFKLAHKSLGPHDWEKLARHWKFDEEHIGAIRHQYSGDNSYKDHGYRMLLIWLFGIDPDGNAMKDLYEALVAIDKKQTAEKVRRKIQQECNAGSEDKTCLIS